MLPGSGLRLVSAREHTDSLFLDRRKASPGASVPERNLIEREREKWDRANRYLVFLHELVDASALVFSPLLVCDEYLHDPAAACQRER